MMNAQILAKTLVPSGQNAQSIQSKQPGSNPARIQEIRQDTSDPTAKTATIASNAQDGKRETSADPNRFKQALTEKMEKPEQAQQPEEPLAESPNSEDATLHLAMIQSQSQVPVQAPSPTSAPLNQTAPDALDIPNPEIPSVVQGDLPVNSVSQPLKQASEVQVAADLPATTLEEPTRTQESSSAQNMEVVQSPEDALSKNTERPLTQENSKTQNADVVPLKPVQTPEPPVTPKSTEPILQAATQPEGFSSTQDHDPPSSKAALLKGTALEPAPQQTSPVTSENKTVPISEAQPKPQEMASKPEPADAPSVEQAPHADAPEPIQVTRPMQQAFSAMIEPSQGQPAHNPETPVSLESADSTSPVLSPPEIQATPNASEVTLPRSLDPAPTPVTRQIQDSIALGVQQNSKQIVIRLDPPELGRVAIRFQEDSQGITGILEVQKSQTRHDIQHALPGIIQQLQDSGVQIKRVEVVLSANADDADTETFEDQASDQTQDQTLEHQQTSDQYNARRNPAYGWPASPDQGVHTPTQEEYASDQGINLLI